MIEECGKPCRRGSCGLPKGHDDGCEWIPPALPFCDLCLGLGCLVCNGTGLKQ